MLHASKQKAVLETLPRVKREIIVDFTQTYGEFHDQ